MASTFRSRLACFSTVVLLASFTSADDSSACCSRNAGFDPVAAANVAKNLSTHSWEYGTAAEALLELYTPELSVFYQDAFPDDRLPVVPVVANVPALAYIKPHIRLDNETLIDNDGASGDPASLGTFALLIGQTERAYLDAAVRQWVHFSLTPRWPNGALSHRDNTAELWADFIYMAPPFFAYYGPAFNTDEAVRFALGQCLLYRQALKPNATSGEVSAGAWQHILGPENEDLGLWSTGNGWAAMGMARVLATLLHWHPTKTGANPEVAQQDLFGWIGEILQAAMNSPKDDGLLRNYLNDTTWFGETSGTALLTATVYRVAVMQEEAKILFGDDLKEPVSVEMLKWANENMKAIAAHVDENGIAGPAVNPLGWGDRTPYTKGSPEGQSFLVLLYAAWRDCVEASVCGSDL